MPSLIESFTDRAAKFSKNPLGIIALFIVLVYGIAGLVFGLSGADLDSCQKWPLIWFLVLFPVLVLGLFGWLVSKHHTKLYAPGDYADKDGFFRALSTAEQKDRLDIEVAETEAEEQTLSPVPPAVAKTPSPISRSSMRSKYVLVEDLMFRELQSEFGIPISRQVGLPGRDIGFDGAFSVGSTTYIVEMKFASASNIARRAREYMERLSRIRASVPPALNVVFLLAIAVEGASSATLEEARKRLTSAMSEREGKYALRIYDFDDLKRKYGLKEEA